jgi:hypothetical protein
MKRMLVGLAALLALAAETGTGAAAAQSDPVGSRRVLLVFAARADDPKLAAQRRIADAAAGGFRERDLVLLPVVGAGTPGSREAKLRGRFEPSGSFEAVLVGRDGGAKLRSADPLPAEQLFDTIDAMPMRQREMRR